MFVCPTCGVSAPGPAFCADDGHALANAGDDALLGTTVGAYRLARRLGRGGMGTVYLGVHPTIGSRVAIKVLLPVAAESQELVDRFFYEARAVNLIKHESIVNVLDLSVLPDGRPYIMMEYLDGQPLSRCFAAWRPFPLDLLVRLMLEVLAALEAAHGAGVVHRDLKPDNIFVTSLNRAKVLDFGIAKLRPDQATRQETRTGALLGTPHYMSPEQIRGEPADARADLYALGVILFQGATGQLPFDGASLYEVFQKHLTEPPTQPRALRSDMPAGLEKVIGRALVKPREERFQSAHEFHDELLPLLRELPESGSLPPRGPLHPSAPPTAASPAFVRAATPLQPTPQPTMTTAASTINPAVRAPSPRASGIGIGVVLGVGAIMIALAALGIASVGAYFAFMRRAEPKGTASASNPPARAKGDRFDPIDYIPKAQARARTKIPDAELTLMLVNGADRDGFVAFDDMRHAVSYNFRSPSASQTSKSCMVSVTISKNGTFDSESDTNCKEPILPKLRCSLAQVAERSPPGELISISVQDRIGVVKWTVATKNGTFLQIPDDC